MRQNARYEFSPPAVERSIRWDDGNNCGSDDVLNLVQRFARTKGQEIGNRPSVPTRALSDTTSSAAHEPEDSFQIDSMVPDYELGYNAAERFHQNVLSRQREFNTNNPPPRPAVEALKDKWGLHSWQPRSTTETLHIVPQESRPTTSPDVGFEGTLQALRSEIEHVRHRPNVRQVLQGAVKAKEVTPVDVTSLVEPSSYSSFAHFLRETSTSSYRETLRALQVEDLWKSLSDRELQGEVLHESDTVFANPSVVRHRRRVATRHWSLAVPGAVPSLPTPAAPKELLGQLRCS